ncbi:MAG: hypothetical protein GY731_12215 [Gammaproteobacteria bacterium]|nr:hypothetical protein [Gammaproteobacteria bacterium]
MGPGQRRQAFLIGRWFHHDGRVFGIFTSQLVAGWMRPSEGKFRRRPERQVGRLLMEA